MKIKNYKEHIDEISALYDNLDFTSENIQKNMSEERWKTVGEKVKTIENAYNDIKVNLKKMQDFFENKKLDEKEAENVYEVISDKISFLSNSLNSFYNILKDNNFEEMNIEGIQKIYKVLDVSDLAYEIVGRIQKLDIIGEIEGANEEYNTAYQDYKNSKNEFAKKHKGQKLNDIHQEFKDAVYEKKKADKAHTEARKKLTELIKKSETVYSDAHVSDFEKAHAEAIDKVYELKTKINDYDHYITQFDRYAPNYLNYINVREEKIKTAENEIEEMTSMQQSYMANYETAIEELNSFKDKENVKKEFFNFTKNDKKNIDEYISNKKKYIDADNLKKNIENIYKLAPDLNVSDLPASMRKMIDELDIDVNDKEITYSETELNKRNKKLKVKDIVDSVKTQTDAIKKDAETLESKLMKTPALKKQVIKDLLNKSTDRYDRRCFELNALEINLKAKVLLLDKTKTEYAIQREKDCDRIRSAVTVKLKDANEQELIDKTDATKIKENLLKLKEVREKELKYEQENLQMQKEQLAKEQEEKKKFFEVTLPAARKKERDTKAVYDQKYEELKNVYTRYKDLDDLHNKYLATRTKRAAAIETFNNNNKLITHYEVNHIANKANKLAQRARDAAGTHVNSSQFDDMEQALKDLTTIDNSVEGYMEVYKAKLVALEEKTKAYQDAKAAQWRPGMFASTLRKTRLAYAETILKFAQNGIKNLEKGSPEDVKKLQKTFEDYNLKQYAYETKGFSDFQSKMDGRVNRKDDYVGKTEEEKKAYLQAKVQSRKDSYLYKTDDYEVESDRSKNKVPQKIDDERVL